MKFFNSSYELDQADAKALRQVCNRPGCCDDPDKRELDSILTVKSKPFFYSSKRGALSRIKGATRKRLLSLCANPLFGDTNNASEIARAKAIQDMCKRGCCSKKDMDLVNQLANELPQTFWSYNERLTEIENSPTYKSCGSRPAQVASFFSMFSKPKAVVDSSKISVDLWNKIQAQFLDPTAYLNALASTPKNQLRNVNVPANTRFWASASSWPEYARYDPFKDYNDTTSKCTREECLQIPVPMGYNLVKTKPRYRGNKQLPVKWRLLSDAEKASEIALAQKASQAEAEQTKRREERQAREDEAENSLNRTLQRRLAKATTEEERKQAYADHHYATHLFGGRTKKKKLRKRMY